MPAATITGLEANKIWEANNLTPHILVKEDVLSRYHTRHTLQLSTLVAQGITTVKISIADTLKA